MTALRAVVVAVLALAFCACSEQDGSSGGADAVPSINRSGLEPTGAAPTDSPSAPLRLGTRPDPVPGEVVVDGSGEALTEPAVAGFAATATDVAVTRTTSGEARAFERLCFGEVDVVDSARSMSADEYATCRANGLDVVQLRVAADAVVVATGSETDVGTDCLSTEQLRAAFGAGSTVERWPQLGEGHDLPFVAGGPGVDVDVARSFTRDVLEVPEPVVSDARADYRVTESEDATRVLVAGPASDHALAATLVTVAPRLGALTGRLEEAWAGWRAAADQPARRAAFAVVSRVRAELAPVARRHQEARAAQQRIAARAGIVGVFSQGYYAAHDRALRPLEIEVADGDGDGQRGCVLPDPRTVLDGSYPLSRSLLLTLSTRSLQRPEVRELVGYHLENAEALATSAGVVPVPSGEVDQQLAWLGDAGFPRFGIGADGGLEALPDDVRAEAPEPPAVETPAR